MALQESPHPWHSSARWHEAQPASRPQAELWPTSTTPSELALLTAQLLLKPLHGGEGWTGGGVYMGHRRGAPRNLILSPECSAQFQPSSQAALVSSGGTSPGSLLTLGRNKRLLAPAEPWWSGLKRHSDSAMPFPTPQTSHKINNSTTLLRQD